VYDVIIVGGGFAGLSAALWLGRCQRRVLVVDAGEPRNQVSRRLHGYLTRDGVSPQDLRSLGNADVRKYRTVKVGKGRALGARRTKNGFEVVLTGQKKERAKLLLLATGRLDPLPAKPGFAEFFGRGVYHCPYCDGYENRGDELVVYGGDPCSRELAEELLTWARRVVICSDGAPRWGSKPRSRRIRVITDSVRALRGGWRLRSIEFASGRKPLPCRALFFATECRQRSTLPLALGCELDRENSIVCNGFRAAGVKDLFVAGNGAQAAMEMNDLLQARRARA
jgi:thioredoxin reductase